MYECEWWETFGADITHLARKIEKHFVEKMVRLITAWSTYTRLRWYCSFSRRTVTRLFSTSFPSFFQSPVMLGGGFWSPVQVHSSSSITWSATSSLSVWLSPVSFRQTSNGQKNNQASDGEQCGFAWMNEQEHLKLPQHGGKSNITYMDQCFKALSYLSEQHSLHLLAVDWREPPGDESAQMSLIDRQMITYKVCTSVWRGGEQLLDQKEGETIGPFHGSHIDIMKVKYTCQAGFNLWKRTFISVVDTVQERMCLHAISCQNGCGEMNSYGCNLSRVITMW